MKSSNKVQKAATKSNSKAAKKGNVDSTAKLRDSIRIEQKPFPKKQRGSLASITAILKDNSLTASGKIRRLYFSCNVARADIARLLKVSYYHVYSVLWTGAKSHKDQKMGVC